MPIQPTDSQNSTGAVQRVTVRIKNKLGLHLRPASQLVKMASTYRSCEISLEKEGQQVNAKSIMGVIMLAAEQGSELVIEAQGTSSAEAVAKLRQLIAGGFGEE